ncbi:MAG: hypothetical protein SFY32_03095 [Bacteroidota bacterium]|nr:hypothetical protein [Bacteroidota bacterium]
MKSTFKITLNKQRETKDNKYPLQLHVTIKGYGRAIRETLPIKVKESDLTKQLSMY